MCQSCRVCLPLFAAAVSPRPQLPAETQPLPTLSPGRSIHSETASFSLVPLLVLVAHNTGSTRRHYRLYLKRRNKPVYQRPRNHLHLQLPSLRLHLLQAASSDCCPTGHRQYCSQACLFLARLFLPHKHKAHSLVFEMSAARDAGA